MEKQSRQKNLADASESNYFENARLRFIEHGITLQLTVENEVSWLNVKLTTLFPLSSPDTYICVHACDGTELGIVKSVSDLDAESRGVVILRLQCCYLLPVVQRILAVKERLGTLEWKVETNLGQRSFMTRNIRETTLRLSANRMLLCDVDGNRYEVSDPRTLDAASRAYLSRYL